MNASLSVRIESLDAAEIALVARVAAASDRHGHALYPALKRAIARLRPCARHRADGRRSQRKVRDTF